MMRSVNLPQSQQKCIIHPLIYTSGLIESSKKYCSWASKEKVRSMLSSLPASQCGLQAIKQVIFVPEKRAKK
jgi:hypothetical protein